MAGVSAQYLDFVKEQLAPIRGVQSGRFFGGVGLSMDGVQFAMLVDNTLYLVVDADTRPNYERMGSRCFSYQTKKRRVDVKKYYAVPGEVLEDQDRLVMLAREAIAVARQAKRGA